MSLTRIHHLNFIVRDLEEATSRFERLLGVEPFETADHAPRGARVAKTPVGESWLVLVCPYDDDSVPGRFLAKHGEGFFLASFGVDDLERHLGRLQAEGWDTADSEPRDGIIDWRVADIGDIHGALLEITQDD